MSSHPTPSDKNRRWDPWPVSIIVFFATAILACVAFVLFCNRHSTELVAPDYYEQEIRYQAQMDRVSQAQRFGDRASVRFDETAKRIVISLPPEHAFSKATGSIQLYRPSSAGMDRHIPLNLDTDGRQFITAEGLRHGLWKVRVLWRVGETEFYIDREMRIPS